MAGKKSSLEIKMLEKIKIYSFFFSETRLTG